MANTSQYIMKIFILLFSLQHIEHVQSNTIQCDLDESCIGQTLICADNEDCTVKCTGDDACDDATIICPSTANRCSIDCGGKHHSSCSRVIVNASSTINGSLTVTAHRHSYAWKEGTVYCPPNGFCEIHCNALVGDNDASTCKDIVVYGTEAKALNIFGIGRYVFRNAAIWCPDNNYLNNGKYQCNISSHYGTNGRYMIDSANIYAVEGFHDVSINCYYSSYNEVIDDCWSSMDTRPKIYCGIGYNHSCTMDITTNDSHTLECGQSEQDTFCSDWHYPSISPTNAPTPSPTGAPTFVPTVEPTDQPTYTPTTEPTQQPSSYPTDNPTAQPTVLGIESTYNKINNTALNTESNAFSSQNGKVSVMMLVSVIGSCVICLLTFAVMLYCIHCRRKSQKYVEMESKEHTNIGKKRPSKKHEDKHVVEMRTVQLIE